MKFLFSLSFLLMTFCLTAQDILLRGSFGLAGLTQAQVDVGPTADLGLELVFRPAQKLQIIAEGGLQRTDYTDRSVNQVPCYFPNGIKIANFTNSEAFEISRTEGYLGGGLRYSLGRLRINGTLRSAFRIHDRITYTDELYILNRSAPILFTTTINPGGRFQQNATTGTIDYSNDFHFQGVFGLAFQLTDRLSIGIDHVRTIGDYDLERFTLRYCENCEDLENPALERRIDAGVKLFRLTGRFRL